MGKIVRMDPKPPFNPYLIIKLSKILGLKPPPPLTVTRVLNRPPLLDLNSIFSLIILYAFYNFDTTIEYLIRTLNNLVIYESI